MTLSQKLLLGVGAVVVVLYLTSSSASASTSGPVTSGGGGGNTVIPNAGDQLLVVTTQTGAAGQLFVRSTPGVQPGKAVGQGNIVAIVPHASMMTATGQAQTAADGTVWWGVTTPSGITGWAESNFLQDQTTSLSLS
jgi:hypothetical protein